MSSIDNSNILLYLLLFLVLCVVYFVFVTCTVLAVDMLCKQSVCSFVSVNSCGTILFNFYVYAIRTAL